MKTNRIILLLCAVALAATSCAPFYKCGEAKPENMYFLTKRAMLLLEERDSLRITSYNVCYTKLLRHNANTDSFGS